MFNFKNNNQEENLKTPDAELLRGYQFYLYDPYYAANNLAGIKGSDITKFYRFLLILPLILALILNSIINMPNIVPLSVAFGVQLVMFIVFHTNTKEYLNATKNIIVKTPENDFYYIEAKSDTYGDDLTCAVRAVKSFNEEDTDYILRFDIVNKITSIKEQKGTYATYECEKLIPITKHKKAGIVKIPYGFPDFNDDFKKTHKTSEEKICEKD